MREYLTGIQHLGIPTKDIAATKAFYEKIGFESIYETMNGEAKVCFLKLEDLVIETYEDQAKMESGAIDHVAINVTDIEKVYEAICEMGLNTQNDEIHFLPFFENGVRFFTILGPNAEKVEFGQFL